MGGTFGMDHRQVLVMTDLVDSTRLNQVLGDEAMAALWVWHDRAARALIRAHGGTEIGRSDGFLAVFPRAAGAAGFALAYHRLLAGAAHQVRARVGVHAGPLSLRRNDPADVAAGATPFEATGLALPVVARVMATAAGGQTLLTADAWSALGDWPGRHVHHGHWRFKGVEAAVELREIGDADAPWTPPADTDKAWRVVARGDLWLPRRQMPLSLPAESDAFVGRASELQALSATLAAGHRLVTVVGPGGAGKTRLALRHAWVTLGDPPGGAFFCDLSAARSSDGVMHAMALGLGLTLSLADPRAQIGRALAARGACLLIVDNAEQVALEVAAMLDAWLAVAPQARVVVTSRQVLALPFERVLTLGPLTDDDAVALFRRRAAGLETARRPEVAEPADASVDDSDVDVDADAVRGLVRLLDGLPLAVELAAARVRLMSPTQMARRMGDRFRLLAASAGRPDRQSTLRRAFDWSWELLAPAEQATFAQLSVFEGGFTLDDAEAVVAHDDPLAPWTLDLMQALIDKSLLRRAADDRFVLLSSLQAYAAERLATGSPHRADGLAATAAAQHRHWRHFATLPEVQVLARDSVVLENLVAACRRAAEGGDLAAAAAALRNAWAVFRLVGPFAAALGLAEQLLARPASAAEDRATMMWVAGSALQQLGRFRDARAYHLAGLALPGVSVPTQARLHAALAEACSMLGDDDGSTARGHFEQALAGAQAIGDRSLQCRVHNGLGALAGDHGQLDDAQRHYALALDAAREAGDPRWEGAVVGNLGWIAYARGDHAKARLDYEQALGLAVRTGDRRWEGNARCNLGLLLLEGGDRSTARAQLEGALALARQMGHARLEATTLCNLGLVVEAEGDLPGAVLLQQQAVEAAEAMGDRRSAAQFRSDLGRLLISAGRPREALDCLTLAQARLTADTDPLALATVLTRTARAWRDLARADAALAALDQAEAVARGLDPPSGDDLGRELTELRADLRGATRG